MRFLSRHFDLSLQKKVKLMTLTKDFAAAISAIGNQVAD